MPESVKPIGSKWVYIIKRKSDETVERFNPRLVAKGFNQIEGVDFFETFSPVAKIITISVGSCLNQQMDCAVLHGDLNEDIYSSRFAQCSWSTCMQACEVTVWSQASRKWYEKLSNFLTCSVFRQANSNPTLFTKSTGSSFTLFSIYVDDILLAGDSMLDIESFKTDLHNAFGIKKLGLLRYFLGTVVVHSSQGILLCQRQYCLDLLKTSRLLVCKPATTPMDPNTRLRVDDGDPYDDTPTYRRLAGLQGLTLHILSNSLASSLTSQLSQTIRLH